MWLKKDSYLRFFTLLTLSVLVLGVSVLATTTITDNKITTTGDVNASNFLYGNIAGYSGIINRQLTSNGNVSVTVCSSGCNYSTIQGALNNVPYILRHKYTINISDGTYNENIIVPPIILSDVIGANSEEGSVNALTIQGNRTNPSGVKINSIQIVSNSGAATPTIDSVMLFGTEPTSDENSSISVYGSSNVVISRTLFNSSNTDYGLMCYSSTCTLSASNFTSSTYKAAVLTKHNGQVLLTDGGVNGSFTTYFLDLQGGIVISGGGTGSSSNTVSAPTLVNSPRGFYLDSDLNKIYGISSFNSKIENLSLSGNLTGSTSMTTPTIYFTASGNLGTNYNYIFRNNGAGRGSLFQQSSTSNSEIAVEVENAGSGNGLFLDQNGNGTAINIDSESTTRPALLIDGQPGDIVPCNSLNEGGIIYNSTAKKHFGCNSTTWNALY